MKQTSNVMLRYISNVMLRRESSKQYDIQTKPPDMPSEKSIHDQRNIQIDQL